MRRLLVAVAVIAATLSPVFLLSAVAPSAGAQGGCAGTSYTSGSCTVTASSTVTTTSTASSAGASATVTIPAGALPAGTTVTVQPVTSTSSVATAIAASASTAGDVYVSAFSISWTAPNGSTPNATKPITMTVTDSAIQAGDVVYELVNGALQKVGVATSSGSVTITFEDDPVFIIMAPTEVALASSAVASDAKTIGVRLTCVEGTICQGHVNLNVARKTKGGGFHQLIVATGAFKVSAGQATTVDLGITSAGKSVVAREPLYKVFRLGFVVTQLSTGSRTVHKVYVDHKA